MRNLLPWRIAGGRIPGSESSLSRWRILGILTQLHSYQAHYSPISQILLAWWISMAIIKISPTGSDDSSDSSTTPYETLARAMIENTGSDTLVIEDSTTAAMVGSAGGELLTGVTMTNATPQFILNGFDCSGGVTIPHYPRTTQLQTVPSWIQLEVASAADAIEQDYGVGCLRIGDSASNNARVTFTEEYGEGSDPQLEVRMKNVAETTFSFRLQDLVTGDYWNDDGGSGSGSWGTLFNNPIVVPTSYTTFTLGTNIAPTANNLHKWTLIGNGVDCEIYVQRITSLTTGDWVIDPDAGGTLPADTYRLPIATSLSFP